jgi:hypothetical protein
MQAPAAAAGDEAMLLSLLAKASPPPGTDPYVAPPGASYSQGLQNNPNLDNRARLPGNTQDLLQRVMMEELTKPKPAPEAPVPGQLPKKVKRPPPTVE